MNKFLFWLIQGTWGVLQNIIGLVLYIIAYCLDGIPQNHEYAKVIYCPRWHVNISCGGFIIVSNSNENTVKHEYGHSIQSLILGIFWIFVMGLPSLIWTGCFDKYRKKHNIDYYDFYTERSANNLGKTNY